jgi:hypothetical protein
MQELWFTDKVNITEYVLCSESWQIAERMLWNIHEKEWKIKGTKK